MGDELVGATTMVGDIAVTGLLDGYGRVNPHDFFVAADGTDIDAAFAADEHARWLDHDGMLTMPIACFLLRRGDRVALMDLGAGQFRIPGFEGGRLPEALAAAGTDPGEIDTVILSHLHFDHVGWATSKDAGGDRHLTFPRASVRCSAADWHHFVEEHEAHEAVLHSALLPIADRVEPSSDGEEVFPGVTVRATPGHTPGHHAFVIADHGERAVILGDALHCPIQLEYGEWEAMGDVDPKLAARTRAALLREIDGDTPVGAPHFPGLQLGRLVTGGQGRRWTPMG